MSVLNSNVNYQPDSIAIGELVMFADDATIFGINDNIEKAMYSLNANARDCLTGAIGTH